MLLVLYKFRKNVTINKLHNTDSYWFIKKLILGLFLITIQSTRDINSSGKQKLYLL